MASGSETIYIKADRNIEVTKPDVTLGDVLKISCVNPSVAAKVKSLRLLRFHHTDKKHCSIYIESSGMYSGGLSQCRCSEHG